MESFPFEKQHADAPKKNIHVRDRIIAFHDRHLRVAPIAEHAVRAFENVAAVMTSQKGRAAVDKLRPKIARIAKNAEVGVGAGEMVIGLVTTGFGAGEFIRHRKDARERADVTGRLKGRAQALKRTEVDPELHAIGLKRPVLLTAIGSGVLAFRPLTRMVDAGLRYGMPVTRRIAQTMDNIMLRREQKPPVKQVFVGQGKA